MLLVASFVVFGLVRATTDPTADLRFNRDRAAVQRAEHDLGLDRPLVVQYRAWLGDFVRGDWGTSSRTSERVFPMVRRALWNTVQLIVWGLALSIVVALAIGVWSATHEGSAGDHVLTALSFTGVSIPAFWFALLAIGFFGVSHHWLYFVGLHEAGGVVDYARHLVLPVVTLSVPLIGAWSRFERAAVLDVLGEAHVRTARAKGVPARRVVWRHAVRNSLAPFVTIVALDAGVLFGGVIITEHVFSIAGMGQLFIDSLTAGDAPALLAWAMVAGFFVIACNLVADLLYGLLDPRVRVR